MGKIFVHTQLSNTVEQDIRYCASMEDRRRALPLHRFSPGQSLLSNTKRTPQPYRTRCCSRRHPSFRVSSGLAGAIQTLLNRRDRDDHIGTTKLSLCRCAKLILDTHYLSDEAHCAVAAVSISLPLFRSNMNKDAPACLTYEKAT
ncbi:hypothetical protein NL676_034590 [Syzygium grande]|nr:hypothetical protein NL676_034590 [Syzygium grande]